MQISKTNKHYYMLQLIQILCFSLCFIAFTSEVSHAQEWQQSFKVTASDQDEDDHYGYSVAIDGDYAIIGAPFDNRGSASNPNFGKGSAYLYQKSNDGSWQEIQKLEASDGESFDHFGKSVDISGNYAVVGAQGGSHDENGGDRLAGAGSAYIFERGNDGKWNEAQKIVASDRGSQNIFGAAVAISGNKIIVGAFQSAGTGAAYFFERSLDGTWRETQKITPTRDFKGLNNGRFGWDVDISGDYAIFGAYRSDTFAYSNSFRTGTAYIFQRQSDGSWLESEILLASDRQPNVPDYFGWSVAITESYALVGSPQDDEDSNNEDSLENAGSVYIFERNADNSWTEVQKIVANQRGKNDEFGESVDLSGNIAIVGSSSENSDETQINFLDDAGSAYIFQKNADNNWIQEQKIVTSDRAEEDRFGCSVSISNDQVLVGARRKSEIINQQTSLEFSGAAYFFQGPPVNTSINNKAKSSSLSVYPNPASTQLTIDSPEEFVIFNVQGVELFRSEGKNPIDISKLEKGIYIIKTEKNQRTFIKY